MHHVSIIAAVDSDMGIARGGDMPWNIAEDLQRFKDLTMGYPIIMGSKTAESLPKTLPGRTNIILTRKVNQTIMLTKNTPPIFLCNNLEEAIHTAYAPMFIIGGGDVYKQALPLANSMYLTRIDESFGCDKFFPPIDWDEWTLDNRVSRKHSTLGYSYHYELWSRAT